MKTLTIISSIITASTLFAAATANAGPMPAPTMMPHHNPLIAVDVRPAPMMPVNVNIPRLEQRINFGVSSGKLTKGEEMQLRSELMRLAGDLRRAQYDGRVGRMERNRLESQEASLNFSIDRLMNNREVAFNNFGSHGFGHNGFGHNGFDHHMVRR